MAVKDIVKGICNITRCKYDVYTKEKTDEIVEEINTSIGTKANSKDFYTKTDIDGKVTEINNTLDGKVNSSSITSGTATPSGGNDGDIYFQYQ